MFGLVALLHPNWTAGVL